MTPDPEFTSYDRDVLYEQVWAEPVRDLAKRYGVSDAALAKACRRLSVPLPDRVGVHRTVASDPPYPVACWDKGCCATNMNPRTATINTWNRPPLAPIRALPFTMPVTM